MWSREWGENNTHARQYVRSYVIRTCTYTQTRARTITHLHTYTHANTHSHTHKNRTKHTHKHRSIHTSPTHLNPNTDSRTRTKHNYAFIQRQNLNIPTHETTTQESRKYNAHLRIFPHSITQPHPIFSTGLPNIDQQLDDQRGNPGSGQRYQRGVRSSGGYPAVPRRLSSGNERRLHLCKCMNGVLVTLWEAADSSLGEKRLVAASGERFACQESMKTKLT